MSLGITLNTVSRDKHVPESVRNVRIAKYQVQSFITTLLFSKFPDRIIIKIVLDQVFWLNVFPLKYVVSKTMSPHQIVSCLEIDYHCHCSISCGWYVKTHEHHGNNMMERAVGAIVLRHNGNRQGRYYFYSILTGRRLNRLSWTELPIPYEHVQRVDKMSHRHDHGYKFTYCKVTVIIEYSDADDDRYAPSDHDDDGGYPSLHHDYIIEPDIAVVDDNINDDDADKNTYDANTDS